MSSERDVTHVDRVPIKGKGDTVEKRPLQQIILKHLYIYVQGKWARAECKHRTSVHSLLCTPMGLEP